MRSVSYIGVGDRKIPEGVGDIVREAGFMLASAQCQLLTDGSVGTSAEFLAGARLGGGNAMVFPPWSGFNGFTCSVAAGRPPSGGWQMPPPEQIFIVTPVPERHSPANLEDVFSVMDAFGNRPTTRGGYKCRIRTIDMLLTGGGGAGYPVLQVVDDRVHRLRTHTAPVIVCWTSGVKLNDNDDVVSVTGSTDYIVQLALKTIPFPMSRLRKVYHLGVDTHLEELKAMWSEV